MSNLEKKVITDFGNEWKTYNQRKLKECIKKLKKNAPFLLYLYYRFDNKPLWYKILWTTLDILRS